MPTMSLQDLSRYLFLAGALPFLFLGSLHAWYTPRTPEERNGLSPADPDVAEAMTRTHPVLTRRINLWQGWVGFNLSHSLGVVMLGALVVIAGRNPAAFSANAAAFVPFAMVLAAAYLAIGIRYFFRVPIAGCALSLALFASSGILLLMRR
jgi:hypothetical protein